MFENFVPTANPDNRHKFLEIDNTDEVIIGATCEHVFELSFNFKNVMKSGKIYYTQGFDQIIEPIVITDDMLNTSGNIIKVILQPTQTSLFKHTTLNTFCQIRFITKNDKVLYDEPHKLRVLEPIVVEPIVGE